MKNYLFLLLIFVTSTIKTMNLQQKKLLIQQHSNDENSEDQIYLIPITMKADHERYFLSDTIQSDLINSIPHNSTLCNFHFDLGKMCIGITGC